MKKINIFINGFGRIGRHCAKILSKDDTVSIVGINDLYEKKQMLHLFSHDSIYGESNPHLLKNTQFFTQKDPKNLPLEDLDIDILLQCSGVFLDTPSNMIYLKKGVRKVIISAPATDETPVYIMGINEKSYQNQPIISASSCSANAIVPLLTLVNQSLGINGVFVSMIHSYTADQNLLDVKHPSRDLRRSRSATQNILPLYSTASYAVSKVMPNLKGKILATSIRIPLSHCTFYDITIKTKKDTNTNTLHELLKYNPLTILDTTEEKLVSTDFIANPNSAIVDLNFTEVLEENLLKITAWQDNEYAYAKRLVELAKSIIQS